MSFTEEHLKESVQVIEQLDRDAIEKMVVLLADLRSRVGRLFFLGVGGGAGNSAHSVNDFRKLTNIETYAPTDNVSELTARINDDGWAGVFAAWLKTSRLDADDMIFILSVGGGDVENNISPNLVEAIKYAKSVGAGVIGVVGRDGGYTAKMADACVIVPTVNPESVTPHTESFQSLVCHLLVSHPGLKAAPAKWESVTDGDS